MPKPSLPTTAAPAQLDLSIKPPTAKALGPAQAEFNKRLKDLEKARAAYDRKCRRFEKDLATCREDLMPLVEELNRERHKLVVTIAAIMPGLKLTHRRRDALEALIMERIEQLFADPAGLSEEEIEAIDAIAMEIEGPELHDEELTPAEQEEFEEIKRIFEAAAASAGVKLDLEGLDPNSDPDEFMEEMERRLAAAGSDFHDAAMGRAPQHERKRKPTKAALERERLKREMEEAKKRDFKSLYKQLAKILHPDLEPDPTLKSHKEAWMKRLTAAHADGDLREMLAIEMEWLGEESGNLASASDEKLRAYSMVLKEQLAELKERTRFLSYQPEYATLHRFFRIFGEQLQPSQIRTKFSGEIRNNREMTAILSKGGTAARNLIFESADMYGRGFSF